MKELLRAEKGIHNTDEEKIYLTKPSHRVLGSQAVCCQFQKKF
jgi:hypothetical protein